MAFSVENLCGLLIRSQLLSPAEMKAMYQRWKADGAEHAASVQHFSRWLVAREYLTEYQAGLLLKGHTEGYFLNQYKILERVGRGRMAGVYRAVHPLGQTVAVKVLPPSRAKHPQTLARFQREAELALQLKHPNVVRAFQIGQSGDVRYLVMEYLEGETVDEVLTRRKRLPPAEGVRIVHQALQGLQHIHEKGMVHRDLKPSNLMLTPAPVPPDPDTTLHATVKILDIGLGRQFFDESQPQPTEQIEITAEGVLLGTPDYLAPEQARDARTIDVRADIYSLGCVLFHCLTGAPPFPDKNLLNQLVRHATEKPKPLREFNPQVPDGLQQIIDWMMAKQPDDRYPTPERAAQALQMFLLADAEPARRIEDAPQMRSYLTWLETGHSEAATVLPEGAAAALAAAAKPAAPAGLSAGQTPDGARTPSSRAPAGPVQRAATPLPPPRERKKKKRPKVDDIVTAQPAPPTVAPPTVAPLEVELVFGPTDPASPAARPQVGWQFSRRDWILIGASAGAALVVATIIVVVVLALS
jgi:serine/threonine protein kinase